MVGHHREIAVRLRFVVRGAVFAASLAVTALLGCEALVNTDGLAGGGVDATGDGTTGAPPGHPGPDGRGPVGDEETGHETSAPEAAPSPEGGPPPTDAGADSNGNALDASPEAQTDAAVEVDCGEGGIACGGSCVDPTRDPANCNGCGNVCHTGQCGTSLAADMQKPPAGWVFNGTAVYSAAGPSAAMTAPDVLYQAGSVIYKDAISVDEFTARFALRIGQGGGSRNDGMGFTIQKNGPTALSGSGAGLGMTGLDGYGVEFDIFGNGSCGDISADHVGVDSLANCPEGSSLPTSLFSTDATGIVDLADAQWHQVEIDLQGGAMSVHVDQRISIDRVSLPGFVPGTPYYFGFAGATGGIAGGPDGGGGYQTEVKDVTFAFPTPRCL